MDGKADLHTHTTYSDGHLSPYELIRRAREVGLRTISITDHDSVSALDEAIAVGRELDVEVIAGMELSANSQDREIHILGYFIDYNSRTLREALAIFREKRLLRAQRIVDKLNRMNIPLTMESVLAHATGESVGRPHIASALVSNGHAESYYQAFNKYIGDGKPAYEKKPDCSPEETVKLISESGGLSFLAHPGNMVPENVLFNLIKAGLDGIEVIHPSHSPEMVRYYRGIVSEYCLLESGGSDFHGGQKNDDHVFGNVTIPTSSVDIMRRRLFSSAS